MATASMCIKLCSMLIADTKSDLLHCDVGTRGALVYSTVVSET